MEMAIKVLAIFCLVVFTTSCQDRLGLVSTPENNAPSSTLASLDDFGNLRIVINKDGEAPVVREFEPIRWDGRSELKPWVFYCFLSLDEAKAAYKNNPLRLAHLEALEVYSLDAGNPPVKLKQKVDNSKLASFSTDAWTEYNGGGGGGYMAAYGNTVHSGESGTKYHWFEVYDAYNSIYLVSDSDTLTASGADLDWDYNADGSSRCNQILDWYVGAYVYLGSTLKSSDGCSSFCDSDESYPCD